jgi:serine/threonine protein kinase
MEYLELGDLYQYLHDKPVLPEVEAKEIALQILEGLEMMHENDFALELCCRPAKPS